MNNIIGLAKRNQSTGRYEVTFGELFYTYQDISDTLVGIMVRAKKRGLIEYEGQGGHMLFQGRHDKVIVTVTILGETSTNGKSSSSQSPTMENKSTTESPKSVSVPEKPHIDLTPKPISKIETSQNKKETITSNATSLSPPKRPIEQSPESKEEQPVSIPKPVAAVKEIKSQSTETEKPAVAPVVNASKQENKIAQPSTSTSVKDAESETPSVVINQPLSNDKVIEKEEKNDNELDSKTEDVAQKPIHAALPQRTNGGTRGAIIYAPKKAEATAEALKKASLKPELPSAATNNDHTAWTQKHLRRLSSGDVAAKTAEIQPMKSSAVAKASESITKSQTKPTVPSVMRKFPWE